jgi:hypothetical protein
MKETSTLLDLISKDEEWLTISSCLGKTPQQCSDWFEYLEDISKHIPKRQKSKPFVQHRKRRKAAQIERLYKCQEKYCYRSYGTEGALKMHIKLKHPSVTYNENYQQQARTAAMLSEKMLEEDDEVSEEEQPPLTAPQSQTPFSVPKRLFSRPAPGTYAHPPADPPMFYHQQGVKRSYSQDFEEFQPTQTEAAIYSPVVLPQPSSLSSSQPLQCDLGRRTSMTSSLVGLEPLPRVEFHPMQINFLCK